MTHTRPQATDWTAYYTQKRSWISTYTQQFTFRIIKNTIDKYILRNHQKIALQVAELGGGNSCFAEQLCKTVHIDTYDIFDNNALSIELFNKIGLSVNNSHGNLINLLDDNNTSKNTYYDFVYSIGLIEHFKGNDIKTIINRHYDYCKPHGIVLVSFPTPTKKYLFIRKCMELLGVWQFHDEEPLHYEDVQKYFESRGEVLAHFINSKLPLTQMIVIAKKKEA